MRYAVLGAGAVGSYVGGMLARAGQPVVLIGRRPHVEAIRRDGLHIGGLVGPYQVRVEASESIEAAIGADILLLCVKSQDTTATCAALAPHLGADVPVVSLQNGVRNLELIDASPLGAGRAVGGIVVFNAVFMEPGRVQLTTSGELVIGAASTGGGFGPRLEAMAAELRAAGVGVRLRADIEGVLWSKLLINLNNGLGAVTGQTTAEAVRDPLARRIAAALVGEGIDVTRAAGIRLGKLPKVDPERLRRMLRLPLPTFLVRALLRLMVDIHPDARGSTWQSLARGQPTEIEFLNGEVVRLAESRGLDAPYNRAIRDLVRAAEAAGAPPDLPTTEVARRMGLN
ncbi:MAG TPA: 2-dehydropantoate 2-reductase [Kofleriaceae bacterium]|nr:2-dehydropantoate 2-reductase [Kofleriaceae bacterium]